jgi:3-dehydrosphinganine reductase
MKNFNGKKIYIVGGSSGIGLEAAKLFAQRGAHVIIFARRPELLKKAAAEIEASKSSKGQNIEWKAVDISDNTAVIKAMRSALGSFGTPDILVNCAGRAYPRHFEDITYEQFDETIRVNLYGMRNVTAALVPAMKERGGHIVNVASIAGLVGVFGYTDYSASKFGVIGFSEVLRGEMKRHGIRVSVLCPPDTDTPGFATENLTKPDETKAVSAGAKIMHPSRVADELLKGIEKNKFIIIPGFDGQFTYLVKRLFPRLVEKIMDSAINKTVKK